MIHALPSPVLCFFFVPSTSKKKQFSLAFWRWVKMENIHSFLFCQVLFLFVCCKADFSYSRCLIRSKPPFLSRLNKEQASEMHTHHTTPQKKISLCVIRLFNQKIYGSLFVAKITNKCWPIYANRSCNACIFIVVYICKTFYGIELHIDSYCLSKVYLGSVNYCTKQTLLKMLHDFAAKSAV